MWFLTKVWVPWWLFFAWGNSVTSHRHTLDQEAAVGFLVWGYGVIAMIITIVYICARAIRTMNRRAD